MSRGLIIVMEPSISDAQRKSMQWCYSEPHVGKVGEFAQAGELLAHAVILRERIR